MCLTTLEVTHLTSYASYTILPVSDRFKVCGSDTMSYSAQMVEEEAFWNWSAVLDKERNTVGILYTVTPFDLAVSILRFGTSPNPTLTGLLNLRPESFCVWAASHLLSG